jgi:hypothetical protein
VNIGALQCILQFLAIVILSHFTEIDFMATMLHGLFLKKVP